MIKDFVIGYEGRAHKPFPLVWGAAAMRNDRGGVFNAVFGDTEDGVRDTYERWLEEFAGSICEKLEVEIEVTSKGPFYVADLRLDLLDRDPYSMENGRRWRRTAYGCVAVARGMTRGYYVFESHAMLERWLYHLHAGAFELVSAKPGLPPAPPEAE